MAIGDKVKWQTVKGKMSGIVESVKEDGFYIVRLPNGKCVLLW